MKKMINPRLPSREDVEIHEMTHLPFRNWCPHRIKGRGIEASHKRAGRDKDALPELHVDFCFMGSEVGEGNLTIVVARERDSRMTLSEVVPVKGSTGKFAASRVAAFIRELGYGSNSIIIKSDQDPAIVAWFFFFVKGKTLPQSHCHYHLLTMILQKIKKTRTTNKTRQQDNHRNHPQSRSRGANQQSWNEPKPPTTRPAGQPGPQEPQPTPESHDERAHQQTRWNRPDHRRPKDRPPGQLAPRNRPHQTAPATSSAKKNTRGSQQKQVS